MKKSVLGIAVAAVVLAGVFTLKSRSGPAPQESGRPVIKIGAILPMTGGMEHLGVPGNNGAILAVEEFNRNPGSKYRYELISDDTSTDVKRAVPIYRKMVGLDGVSAIISFDSQVGHVIKPLAAQDRMLHVSSAADPSVADGEYNFINSSDLHDAVTRLLNYFEKTGYKRIAIAGVHHAASAKVIGLLEERAKDFDVRIVARELVNPTERRIQPEARKIVKSDPDVVFLYGFEPMTTLYAKELRNAGYEKAVSSIYSLSYSEHPELLEGAVYLDYGGGTDDFKGRYRRRFGREPNAASVVLFDSVSMIARMHEDGSDIKKAVEGYSGLNGRLTLKDGGLIHADMVFVRMTGGKPVAVKVKE